MQNGQQQGSNDTVEFHLRKEFSYGNLISTILLGIMLLTGYVRVEQQLTEFRGHLNLAAHAEAEHRLDDLENSMARVEVETEAINIRFELLQREIISRLDRIEDRFDDKD